jgi:thioredoxin-like negative regulator of GroEL
VDPVDLTDEDFTDAITRAPRAVVNFHVGDSAGCVVFKPKFRRLAAEWPGVAFFVADGRDAPAARKTLVITTVPFVAAYRDGALVEALPSADEPKLRAFLERHFGPPTAAP